MIPRGGVDNNNSLVSRCEMVIERPLDSWLLMPFVVEAKRKLVRSRSQ